MRISKGDQLLLGGGIKGNLYFASMAHIVCKYSTTVLFCFVQSVQKELHNLGMAHTNPADTNSQIQAP